MTVLVGECELPGKKKKKKIYGVHSASSRYTITINKP